MEIKHTHSSNRTAGVSTPAISKNTESTFMTKQEKDQYLAVLSNLYEKTKAAINEVLKAFTPEDAVTVNVKVQAVFSSLDNLHSLAKLVTEADFSEQSQPAESYADICKRYYEHRLKKLAAEPSSVKEQVINIRLNDEASKKFDALSEKLSALIDQNMIEDFPPEELHTKWDHDTMLFYGSLLFSGLAGSSLIMLIRYLDNSKFYVYLVVFLSTSFISLVCYGLNRIIKIIQKPATG